MLYTYIHYYRTVCLIGDIFLFFNENILRSDVYESSDTFAAFGSSLSSDPAGGVHYSPESQH